MTGKSNGQRKIFVRLYVKMLWNWGSFFYTIKHPNTRCWFVCSKDVDIEDRGLQKVVNVTAHLFDCRRYACIDMCLLRATR